MEPIISPWLIYWINLLGNLQVLFFVSSIILLLACIISLVCWKSAYHNEDKKDGRMWFKRCFILLLIVAPIVCFAPGRTTVIQMLVAKNITYERVDKALVAGKGVKDELKKDVIDILSSINKKEEPKESNGK